MTPPTALALLAGALVACSGSSFNQGSDFDGSPDDTSTGGTGGTGDDSGNGSGTGGDDSGGDDGTTAPAACANAWHPLDQSGWTKAFDVTYKGTAGTGLEEGMGGEDDRYVFRDAVTVTGDWGEDGWDVLQTVGCDYDGHEGMFILEWFGTTYISLGDFGFDFVIPAESEATLDPYRQYLPPEYAVGATGSWDYSYTLTVLIQTDTGQPQPMVYQVTGTYAEVGTTELELFDGTTAEAYRLTNTYSTSSDYTAENGYIEQWWVKGLGLVEEVITNTDDSSEIFSKKLTAYSGLEIDE